MAPIVMSWASALALGLPPESPPFDEHRPLGEPAMFAIFNTAPLTRAAQYELEEIINSGTSSSFNSKLAPQPDFSNHSLRDVYDHFVTLRSENENVQPFYFIVADQIDYRGKGVLGVCLDCSQEGDGDMGVARCAVDMADSWGSQFHNGLADWNQMREAESDEWGSINITEDVDPEQKHADEATKYGWTPQPYAIQQRYIYGWYSLVKTAIPINRMLDPTWLGKTPDQCRFQMLGNYHTSKDPWGDICREHPGQSANRPRVHRTIILVAEKEDASQADGFAVVRLESSRNPKILARVSASIAIREADRLVEQLGL